MHIPFKIIINLSENLDYYDWELKEYIPLNLTLKQMFPNSIIINLRELNSEIIKELSDYIESVINKSSTDDSKIRYEKIKKFVRQDNE